MSEKISMDEAFIQRLKKIIDRNLTKENFGVSELAKEVGLSRSQLHRRLKSINDKSSSRFINEYRLQKAMEMLRQNLGTVSEIGYSVGFSSSSYFIKCFHDFYGYPPGEVRFRKLEPSPNKIPEKRQVNNLMWVFPLLLAIATSFYFWSNKSATIDLTGIEKSIAVLPFVNDSSDETNLYFCNGINSGIREQLSKVPEFIVLPRGMVEKYKDSAISPKQIAKALGVNFLVEGRVQRLENRTIISAELIYAKDNKILWSDRYDKNISEIFNVQTNVIESISKTLKTILSSDIEDRLEHIPTKNQIAYDHYLKGEEYRFKANRQLQRHQEWLVNLDKSRLSYELAIETDTLFAMAYLGLAKSIYYRMYPYRPEEGTLEHILGLVNKAIILDSNYANAYIFRGTIYERNNRDVEAKIDFEKAYGLAPNHPDVLIFMSNVHYENKDFEKSIAEILKVEKVTEDRESLIYSYNQMTLFTAILRMDEEEDYYYNKIEALDTTFFGPRIFNFLKLGQVERALSYVLIKCPEDNQLKNGLLAYLYMQMRDNKKAQVYYEKLYDQIEEEGITSFYSVFAPTHYGTLLIKEGQIEKGRALLEEQLFIIEDYLDKQPVRWVNPLIPYYKTILYATLGDYEKCYENLKIFEESEPGWLYSGDFVSFAKRDVQVDILQKDSVFLASLQRGEKRLMSLQDKIRPYFPTNLTE